jgi:hypothetical protein
MGVSPILYVHRKCISENVLVVYIKNEKRGENVLTLCSNPPPPPTHIPSSFLSNTTSPGLFKTTPEYRRKIKTVSPIQKKGTATTRSGMWGRA